MQSILRRTPAQIRHRSPLAAPVAALAGACLLAGVLAALLAARAHAADGPQYGSIGQYGQAARFGGFDASAYDNEKYDGTLSGGQFLNPVGFAVDTQDDSAPDDTAIYVLERVSDWGIYLGGSPTEWRLQKLSDTGTVLASTLFTLPTTGFSAPFTGASALGVENPAGVLGLAVDDATGTVYTLLYGTVGSGNGATPEAEEIIGWSTTPSGDQLVKPAGSTSDSLTTAVGGSADQPGVFSTAGQLTSTPLYDPQGLALDVSGGQNALAIEADGTVRASDGSPQGPTVVEQVSLTSPTAGDETASWLSSELSGFNVSSADLDATAAGISTAPEGSLDVLLNPTIGGSVLDAVDLPAGLNASPTVLASSDIDPADTDIAPLAVADTSGNSVSAGPQAVALSNGLFASDFYEDTGGAGYFDQGLNEGIRLVSPAAGGVLAFPSTPSSSTIFDTLGNSSAGGPCHLGSSARSGGVSLAPGAGGAIWVLLSGQDSSAAPSAATDGPYTSGREVIELAPGGGSACAGPTTSSGTFTLADGAGSPQPASTPLTVSAGATVNFNAATISYPTGASISAYDWDPTGSGAFTTVSDTLSAGAFQPTPTASYQYTTPGVYSPQLTLQGDFGAYVQTGSVTVLASSPPTAAFSAPTTAQTGQSVSFDASNSQPASGAQIADYHWSFGDGQTDDTQSATDTHTYASPGTYTVTLVVRDNDTQSSTAATQQITVSSPPSGGGGGGGGTTTTTTSANSGSAANAGTASTLTKPKPLTSAEKLASALKACKKKPKKKRPSCEKQARKKYAKKSQPKTKKK